MPRTLPRSLPMGIFVVLGCLVTVADYVDHVTRPGSWFAAHPLRWMAFTVACIVLFLGTILLVRALLQRISSRSNLGLDLLAVATGPLEHVYLGGPLADRLFAQGDLIFHSPWPLVLLACGGYLVTFGLTHLGLWLRRRRVGSQGQA